MNIKIQRLEVFTHELYNTHNKIENIDIISAIVSSNTIFQQIEN